MDEEDLFVNPFFVTLCKKFPNLYREAENFCYVICVPQKRALRNQKITREDIETHILGPSPEKKGEYISKNKRVVKIQGKSITTGKGFSEIKHVKILFEELSYNENDQQFRILCLEQLLEGDELDDDDPDNSAPDLPPNFGYEESQKYLASFPENTIVLNKINQLTHNFCSSYVLIKGSEVHIVERVSKIVEQATEFLGCANKHLRSLYNYNYDDMQQMVESYVMHGIHDKIFSAYCDFFRFEDANLLYVLKCLEHVPQTAYGVSAEYCIPQLTAINSFQQLDKCKCPIDMLLLLKRVKDEMTEAVNSFLNEQNKTECLSADELFPITIYVIVQSKSSHLFTCSRYIDQMTFVDVSISELGYNLVSFQAALQYLKDSDFTKFEGYHSKGVETKIPEDRFKRIFLEPFVVPNRPTASFEIPRRHKTLTDSFPQLRIPQPPATSRSVPVIKQNLGSLSKSSNS